MRTYFSYLFRTLVKRSSNWIVFSIYWLYALVILIIVQATTHISPLTLWSTDMISLQGMFVVILSVVIGVVVVFAFRASIEDETELIIVSKPIKRWKLNLVKFAWTLIAALFLAFVTSVIALFTMCFGQYDAVNNPSGMRFDKMAALIGSIWLGTVVASLIFGAFGILVSMIGNKIQVLVTLIATAIVFSVYATIATFVLTPLYKQMQGKIGNKLASFKTISQSGNNTSYAYTFNEPNDDLYDLYLQYPQTGTQVYQYFNFQAQLSGLYNAFDVNDLTTNLQSTPFGASAQYNTSIESKDDNLLNYLVYMYENRNEHKDDALLLMPYTNSVLKADDAEGVDKYNIKETDDLRLMLVGPQTDALYAMKYAGAKPDSVYVSNSSKLLSFFPARWLSMKDLYVSEDFEKAVFNEITKELFTGKSTTLINNKYRDINGSWDMVDNPSSVWEWYRQQQIFQDYFGLCYKLMTDHDEFNLQHDTEQHINDSMAKIWVAMTKQFTSIYWFQVVDQIISYFKDTLQVKDPNTGADYSFKQYINCNDAGALKDTYGVDEKYKNFSTFEYAFVVPTLEIKNPYTDEVVVAKADSDINVMKLTRMCMGYASTCIFKQNTMTSTITQALTTYNNIGNETFAGAYANITQDKEREIKPETADTDGWGFDYGDNTYGKGKDAIYDAIAAATINIKQYANNYGLANMYHYRSIPFINNNVSIIVWTSVSIILIII